VLGCLTCPRVYQNCVHKCHEVYLGYHVCMPATTSTEKGIRELRATLSKVVNDAAVRGRITYITSHTRRVAAVVPVPVAEDVEAGATLRGLRRYVAELKTLEQKPDVLMKLRIIEETLDAAERRADED